MTYNGFVFFDIDGTLVNSQGQVPIENKRAIAQLRANGFLPLSVPDVAAEKWERFWKTLGFILPFC